MAPHIGAQAAAAGARARGRAAVGVVGMPIIKRDQNLLTALKTGVYNVRIQTKNLLTGQFTDNIVNLLDKNSFDRILKMGLNSMPFV